MRRYPTVLAAACMLLAAPLVIEMVYDVFLQLVQAQALAQSLLRHERRW